MKRTIICAFLLLAAGMAASAQIKEGEIVSRNEFGIDSGVIESPSGALKAIYVKDESAVTDFPLLDISTRTGDLVSIKYPMNGMPSEKLSLIVRDTLGTLISTMQVTDFTDERYLTGVTWSPDEKYLFIQVLDRSQHHMHLNMYRVCDGSYVRTILTEDNDAWVEPLDPLYFIKSSYRFIYRTDNRDGYRNLYICDTLGNISRFTKVDADVAYKGNDGKYVYYTSAEVSPVENHLFRKKLGIFAKPERLTTEPGWHNIRMDDDCSWTDIWSSKDEPWSIWEQSRRDSLKANPSCIVEMGTVKSADGQFDNYYRLVKPLDFDPSKKYPVILYVYGGPHSQMVTNTWNANMRAWEARMARRGYVLYIQDNRGTQNRGAAYEKAINRACGQAEMADQMAGLREVVLSQPWADTSRVGVHGWSYGGFMTISLAVNYPEVFKVAVAGGPVIDWKWYEVMYGERYMDTPETNPEGFELTSLIGRTRDLKARLMICQGMMDETVVPQHCLNFVQECIIDGVQLDFFPYPADKHNMRGKAAVHLYDKITAYFVEHL